MKATKRSHLAEAGLYRLATCCNQFQLLLLLLLAWLQHHMLLLLLLLLQLVLVLLLCPILLLLLLKGLQVSLLLLPAQQRGLLLSCCDELCRHAVHVDHSAAREAFGKQRQLQHLQSMKQREDQVALPM
jgi:hypothetical protein